MRYFSLREPWSSLTRPPSCPSPRLSSLLLVFSCLQQYLVHAMLTVTWPDNNVTAHHTMDFFNNRTEYYEQTGMVIFWQMKGKNCTYQPLNQRAKEDFSRTLNKWANTPDLPKNLAVLLRVDSAYRAGCDTAVQSIQAIDRWSKDVLEPMGFPPVTLAIISATQRKHMVPTWGPRTAAFRSSNPSIPDLPKYAPLTASFVADDQFGGLLDMIRKGYAGGNYTAVYHAVQERGVWNDYYLSTGFTVFLWFIRILLGCSAVYTIARLVKLARLGRLKADLRLIIAILAILSCAAIIPFLNYFVSSLAGRLLSVVKNFLTTTAFDLLLWHWTVRGRSAFSRKLIVSFRIAIIIHIILNIIGVAFTSLNLATFTRYGKNQASHNFMMFVHPYISGFGVVVFFGFSLWFFCAVYRLRKHSKARWRFIQLAILSFLSSVAFAVSFSNIIKMNMEGRSFKTFTEIDIMFFDTANIIIVVSRSLICLAVLGIAWPTKHTKEEMIAQGLETTGWSTRMWRQLISVIHRTTGTTVNNNSTKNNVNSQDINTTNTYPNKGQDVRHNILGEETTINLKIHDALVVEQTNHGQYYQDIDENSTVILESVNLNSEGPHVISSVGETETEGATTFPAVSGNSRR